MATKLSSFTLDTTAIDKLDWLIKNTSQKSKSALVNRLIELEYVRVKAIKITEEEPNVS